MTLNDALDPLKLLLGDRLSLSSAMRAEHGANESYFPQMLPDAVAFPESTV
ncbi:hypothetical protein FALB51S_02149 [Frigidibacter albus]